jgi:hypothetical protein
MHTNAGRSKLFKVWLVGKYFWLQPLLLLFDFMSEGPLINFTEISQLRSYMGNQISFYLSWKSYNICFWGPLGILGLLYHVYISYTEDYYSVLSIYWILVSQVYLAVQIQL